GAGRRRHIRNVARQRRGTPAGGLEDERRRMKPTVRLLLPILSPEEIDVFEEVPAASLLATGNIPAVGELADTTFCVVAPADLAARVTTSTSGQMIGRHARLHVVPSDELMVDGAFDAVPSLAYLKGIADCGDALTTTSFVFLQPNLILGDGALRSVM